MKTFRHVYRHPFKATDLWVYDANGIFMFEFSDEPPVSQSFVNTLVDVINGKSVLTEEFTVHYDRDHTCIIDNNYDTVLIDIRGWGYLTGTGGLNLPEEEAINIQDTLAEYIVKQLNRRL